MFRIQHPRKRSGSTASKGRPIAPFGQRRGGRAAIRIGLFESRVPKRFTGSPAWTEWIQSDPPLWNPHALRMDPRTPPRPPGEICSHPENFVSWLQNLPGRKKQRDDSGFYDSLINRRISKLSTAGPATRPWARKLYPPLIESRCCRRRVVPLLRAKPSKDGDADPRG